jgi:phosphoribosylglycinamide formyltransferase-1
MAGTILAELPAARMKRIAIFASGTGSNAGKIIDYFADREYLRVALILTNNPKAGVLDIAADRGIDSQIFSRAELERSGVVRRLQQEAIDLVVLAGFMWKIPERLIAAFPRRIVNIHPALLPKFGGKGMYGMNVHRAVIAAGEMHSGLTIHWVDEQYDHGDVIFQARCEVTTDDTPETLAKKIQALEHRHYPVVIERILKDEGADT